MATMTLRELFAAVDGARVPLLIGLGAVVVLTALIGVLHGRDNGGRPPWRHLYAVLVYAACAPGIFAAVTVVYALLFSGDNLLDLNAATYLAPIAAMVLTLGIMRRNVRFDEVPGFGRITGLMTMIGAVFAIALILKSLRVWLFFSASLVWFLVLVVAMFVLVKWGGRLLFGRGRQR
ncbi:MAG: hypothetical protein OXC12_11780 [Spirochaetaceae bacterium]|nr:hypothetical protein [Spirochaetaceae bacterium]